MRCFLKESVLIWSVKRLEDLTHFSWTWLLMKKQFTMISSIALETYLMMKILTNHCFHAAILG
ncbi:hypothetical protein WDU94_008113 [Cyamophila willieti]